MFCLACAGQCLPLSEGGLIDVSVTFNSPAAADKPVLVAYLT